MGNTIINSSKKKWRKKTEVQIKFIYIDQLFSIYTSSLRDCGNGKESNETVCCMLLRVFFFLSRFIRLISKNILQFCIIPIEFPRQFFKSIALSMQFPNAFALHVRQRSFSLSTSLRRHRRQHFFFVVCQCLCSESISAVGDANAKNNRIINLHDATNVPFVYKINVHNVSKIHDEFE